MIVQFTNDIIEMAKKHTNDGNDTMMFRIADPPMARYNDGTFSGDPVLIFHSVTYPILLVLGCTPDVELDTDDRFFNITRPNRYRGLKIYYEHIQRLDFHTAIDKLGPQSDMYKYINWCNEKDRIKKRYSIENDFNKTINELIKI